ncbi:MAG TPA: biotin--[acetyl-CoA-carboxylase] ligase [Gemmata sp.]|jgi:BirA family biotin operon repressor/biotin-[acetyl-CoA-carboxylase] ligase|nr:biotin--[acetyl-CoA-carboxylase] ligase [Gemmata sp.]
MIPASETWSLDTSRIGRRVLVFDKLASTNTTAAEFAASSDTDGLVVIADFQTTGRGQYGRVWQSRPGSSLLMSVVLNPPNELCRPAILTAFAAVAVAEAIFTFTGIQSRIKWPNDLLIRGKKVCGILIEQHGSTAILGLGLNLNQTAEEFAGAGLPDATSLGMASGGLFEMRAVAGIVIHRLDREYDRLLAGDRIAVEADWKWRIGLLGRQVTLELMDGSTVAGRLREMEFDRLELEMGDGTIQAIVPETVRHIVGM